MASTPLDEESVFKVARKIASPEARADYLKQACDDDSVLRDRLDALLRAHDEERSFLESPPPGLAATIDSPLVEQPGQTIGRYKLLETTRLFVRQRVADAITSASLLSRQHFGKGTIR
jgi:hypothetical protein